MYSKYSSLKKIYESANSIVYRGQRVEDNQPVILKILKQDYPTAEELLRYHQEYDITRRLSHLNGVINAYDIEKYKNTLIIYLEDFGGESLKNHIIDIPIAIKIAEILGQIHQQNIIHKDINPSNIVYNYSNKILKIIDFGISTQLARQHLALKNPEVLEGTLAYMSPEQTGRMNRALDYRSDFYSLGVTFYELFTGKLPFEVNDAMELVHCHLAKQPVFPDDLPPMLSKIIMKLMAKTAEERYQSAWGIKADLEQVLNNPNEIFELGQFDVSERFQISQKLYGRDNEIKILVDSQGDKQMMLIAGYSGIGKSVLVKELYKSLTKKRGYFISGKYDQLQRNVPYSALVSSFSDLIKQLLMETDAQLEQWKQKILAAVGVNGRVIIEVIPDVEAIIGEQPPVSALDGAQSLNRFNLVFQNFIRVFDPLVIFLDDLQWIDSASLTLLEVIMRDKENNALFLIGAYRDNEVSATHPLMMTVDKLRQQNLNINQISLKPLKFEHVNQLIADSLDMTEVTSLTELVMQKTDGNPFFVNQFLTTLYQENLLNFDHGWKWNIEQIEAMNITDNVVDLMIGKLKKLPKQTQQVLPLAAAIGNSFDLNILPIITLESLLPAIQNGLIIEINEKFIFSHDRVQQAAYALIDENQKQQVHLQIGRLLLTTEEIEENIFDIIGHFNISLNLINQSEKKLVVQLNLKAAKKAKAATAYAAALKYLTAAISCLTDESSIQDYALSLELYQLLAEVEYLNGNFEAAEKLFDCILQQVKTDTEKAKIYNLRMILYTNLGRWNEVFDAGIAGLKALNLKLPLEAELVKQAIVTELAEAKSHAQKVKNVADLINAPEITDAQQRVAMNLLMNMISPAYVSNQDLCTLFVLKMVNLSFKYGNTPSSAFGFVWFGWLGMIADWLPEAYEYSQLAIHLNNKFNNVSLNCKLYLLSGLVDTWRRHITNSIDYLLTAYQQGIEHGDLVWAGYTFHHIFTRRIIVAKNLDSIVEECEQQMAFLNQTQDQTMFDLQNLLKHVALNLQTLTYNKFSFSSKDFNAEQCVANWLDGGFVYGKVLYNLYQIQIHYLHHDYATALKIIKETEPLLIYIRAQVTEEEFSFYTCLCILASYTDENQSILDKHTEKIKKWAKDCPDNFLHKLLLIEAEKARLAGKNLEEVMNLYDRAIELARKNEFLLSEAIGNELAAKFWLEKSKQEFAELYFKKAHYGYLLWGAKVKSIELEKKYPQFVKTNSKQHKTTTTITSSNFLDLSSVIKASQTLSKEIVFSRLLKKMMQIVIENAGAEIGFLLLPKHDKWFIQSSEQSIPLENSNLPLNLIHYVIHTQQYIIKHNPKSILCLPLLNQNKLTGILYLENNLIKAAFTAERLEVLKILSAQLAISIENSLSYENLEQKVAERTIELEKANQAKSEFLSNMSHELRTPLNGILGYAQILKRARNLEETQVSGLKTIYNSGNHLLTLINDILDLSKIEAGKLELYPENITCQSFIDSLTGIIRMRAEQKDICFCYETIGDLPLGIEVDEKRLRQVLLNLLGNAIKFTDKGQVTLRISAMQEGIFRFEVADTGVGMTDEDLQKIFKPFEQVGDTQRRAEGTGLGLAISRQLVELMDSEIKVKSEIGKGSTFYFDLALKVVAVEEKTEQHRITGYKGETQTALIVDDYTDNRLILRQMLENIGFKVIEAANGKQGIKLANKANIIFMDLIMPIMTGVEAVEIIRKDFKQLPIIAISASVFESDKQKSLQAGCNAFLAKPIEEQQLFNVLIEYLNLDWVYEEEQVIETKDNQTLIPPPAAELETLYQLAMMGDMREIKDFAMQLDEEYAAFANKLIELANEFEDEAILALVEEYINNK